LLVIILIIIIEEAWHPGVQKTDRIFILYSFLAFGLSYLLSEFLLKNIFQRIRPDQLFTTNCPTDFSFPSTHAVTAFAIATIISYFDKKRTWFYFLVAYLIALSRLYLGCHYFFDVLAGAVFGYSISKFILKANRFLLSPDHKAKRR